MKCPAATPQLNLLSLELSSMAPAGATSSLFLIWVSGCIKPADAFEAEMRLESASLKSFMSLSNLVTSNDERIVRPRNILNSYLGEAGML